MKPFLSTLFLLAGGLALADDHVVPAGQFADVTYKVGKGDIVNVRVTPAPVQKAAKLEPGRFIFAGEPGVKYQVRGYIVNFKAEKFEEVDDTYTFAGKADPDDGKKKDDKKVTPAPVAGRLFLVIVEETADRANNPGATALLNDTSYLAGLVAKDVHWRVYDKDSPDVVNLKYLPHATRVGLPAVLLLNARGDVLDARRLTGKADTDAVLKGVGR